MQTRFTDSYTGRDTTAATLSIIVYMLAQEPQVLHRLRQEVLNQVGNSRRPTLDDFKYMKYMRAVINGTFAYDLGARSDSVV